MAYLCSWTIEELRSVIVLLKRPEFKPADIEEHKRIARAVHDKMIKSFNMRERAEREKQQGGRSGPDHVHRYQDLTMFMREVEEVVRGIMGGSCFKGHQHYKFEAEFDYADEKPLTSVVGGKASAGVAF